MPARSKHASGLNSVLFKALSNALRARILVMLNERPASPKELATALGESLGNVSHHVRELAKLGLIELVDEKRRRGAVEHFYRGTARAYFDAAAWETLPTLIKEAHGAWVAQLVVGDIAEAMEEGTFESRSDRYLTRIPLLLDEDGWAEVIKAHDELIEKVYDAQAASAKRLNESGGESFQVSACTACFEMPPPRSKNSSNDD